MGKTLRLANDRLFDLTRPHPGERRESDTVTPDAGLHHKDDIKPIEGTNRRKQSGGALNPPSPQSSPHRLYRPKRLAELLNVSLSTLWRWQKRGVLPPPVKIGGIRGWTECQVANLLKQNG